MTLWQSILEKLGLGRKLFYHPDLVKCPDRYRSEMKTAFWMAAARLEGQGIFGHSHRIREIVVIPGTHLRDGGMCVANKASPTGFAGGWTGSGEIVWVKDDEGEVPRSTMLHEWGEAILLASGDKRTWTQAGRHEILGKAGL